MLGKTRQALLVGIFALTCTAACGGGESVGDAVQTFYVSSPGSVWLPDVSDFSTSWRIIFFVNADGTAVFDRSIDSGATWCREPMTWSVATANENTLGEQQFIFSFTRTEDVCGEAKGSKLEFQMLKRGDDKIKFIQFNNTWITIENDPNPPGVPALYMYRCTKTITGNDGSNCDIPTDSPWGTGGQPTPLGAPY